MIYNGFRMKHLTSLVLLLFLSPGVNAYIPDTIPEFDTGKPALGKLLVASEGIDSGIFWHSVIVITNYGPHGTTGLIINRPSGLQVNEAVPGLVNDDRAGHLFIGGPVGQSILSVIFKVKHEQEGSVRIMPDMYLDFGIRDGDANHYFSSDMEAARIYSGYAGWAAGQLETELNGGAWYILNGDPYLLFEARPDDMWETLIRKAQGQ